MAESASAVAIADANFFASDVRRPPTPPDKIAEAFQNTLLSFRISAKNRPIVDVSDKLNAMIEWAWETRETQNPPPHEGLIAQRDMLRTRQDQAITRNFILQALKPLDTLANILILKPQRADELHVTLPLEQRMYLAEMNQRLARGIYAASHPGAPKELKENAQLFIQFLNGLKHLNTGLGDLGKLCMAGAVAHAQAIRIFDDPNHLVYLPNIENSQELLQWEHHGADLVVWRKGRDHMVKLDVKGSKTADVPQIMATDSSTADEDILRSLIPLMKRDLEATGEPTQPPTQIVSIQLTLPVNLRSDPLERLSSGYVNHARDIIDGL